MNGDEMEQTTDDPTLAGILLARGIQVSPFFDDACQRVLFKISGDLQSHLEAIGQNEPIGSGDVYRGIKAARSLLFAAKRGHEGTRR